MRRATLHRKTNETDIRLALSLDGKGRYEVSTGIRFLDHMLELFARHGGFDLKLTATGDLDVDQHHTVEDVGIALGEAFQQALGGKHGLWRAGYFVMPMDETLGLAAVEGDRVLVLNDATSHEQACIFTDSAHHTTAEFTGSLYERAVVQDRPVVIEDLVAYPGRTRIEEELIRSGVRTFICAPLHYQDRVIGTMELVSSHVGDLNATHLPKLQEVLPLFSMAVQRSVEELNSRIQTVINEQCTAIHPTVEWRFRKAVLNAFERQRGSASVVTELEPIVFEGVYPLFGLADIRGSSTQRGRAIQTDLLHQLHLARAVIQSASETRPGPALDELAFRIDSRAAQIERGLNSSDEIGVIAFLRSEVEGLLDHLGTFGGGVRERIAAYRAGLDPRLGTVYHRRRMFEQSVTAPRRATAPV